MSEHRCAGCDRQFDTSHQLNGHQAQCPARRKHAAPEPARLSPTQAEPAWLTPVSAPSLPAAPAPRDEPPAWIGRMPLPDPEPSHVPRRLQNHGADETEDQQERALAPVPAASQPTQAAAEQLPAAAAPAAPAKPRASIDVFALVRLVLDGTADAAGSKPLSEEEAKLFKASIDDMGWSMSPGAGFAAILGTILVTRAAAHPVVQRAVRRQIEVWLKPGSKGVQVMAGATVLAEAAQPAQAARPETSQAAAPAAAPAPAVVAAASVQSVDDLWAEEERRWKAQEGDS